jgi:hypothetical protein
MPVRVLNVEDRNLRLGLGLSRDLEEFSMPVLADVQGDDSRGSTETPRSLVGDLEPGPDPGELAEQVIDVHS